MGTNGKFSDGFLLGSIFGAAAVFLLGTKKGNKVLKVITEEGIDGLSDLIKDLEESNRENRSAPKNTANKVETSKEDKKVNEVVLESNGVKPQKSPRKFFKKSK